MEINRVDNRDGWSGEGIQERGTGKDSLVINEQTESGSFVPWQPAQITIYWEIWCQPLAWLKFNGDVWKVAFVTGWHCATLCASKCVYVCKHSWKRTKPFGCLNYLSEYVLGFDTIGLKTCTKMYNHKVDNCWFLCILKIRFSNCCCV